MQHTIKFEGGAVEMKLIPTKVVFKLADIAGDAVDTKALSGEKLEALMGLLSDYSDGFALDDISVEDVDDWDGRSFAGCPLPWGMRAFEAAMDFFFPDAKSTSASA